MTEIERVETIENSEKKRDMDKVFETHCFLNTCLSFFNNSSRSFCQFFNTGQLCILV